LRGQNISIKSQNIMLKIKKQENGQEEKLNLAIKQLGECMESVQHKAKDII